MVDVGNASCVDKSLESYLAHCKEVDVIEKKLEKDDVPEGKKEKLRFRHKQLHEQILPGLKKQAFTAYC